MSGFSPEPANLPEVPDLGPLTLTRVGGRCQFTLTAPGEVMLELPPNYETCLTENLTPLFDAPGEQRFEMDLQNLPALSSRHLGLMLVLRKILADRDERLHVTGVSAGVRRLLTLTRTEQFFDFH